MLRLRAIEREPTAGLAPPGSDVAGPEVEIVRVFDDPLLEVGRLLREAANIEHALMVQYLYAAFSLKPRYQQLAGDLFATSQTVIGVAIQEMQHLAKVNALLVALKAQPNLDREDFPIRTDIYPFDLELEPLTLASCAKYVTAEAPLDALDPNAAGSESERRFRENVAREVGLNKVNHIGSLYGTVIDRLRETVERSPGILPDSERWLKVLELIRGQGEKDHFDFFRSVFEGTHPAFGEACVWQNAASDEYPSRPLPKNPTAFEGSPNSIVDPTARRLATLSNIHYWVVLGLLHHGHATSDMNFKGRAISHMAGCLYPLGLKLSEAGVGLPFDAMAMNFGTGTSHEATVGWLRSLVEELRDLERDLSADLGPDYKKSPAVVTLKMLGGTS